MTIAKEKQDAKDERGDQNEKQSCFGHVIFAEALDRPLLRGTAGILALKRLDLAKKQWRFGRRPERSGDLWIARMRPPGSISHVAFYQYFKEL